MALLASQLYVDQTEHRNNVFGMTTELFSNHLEMLCERGFPLLKRINKILGVCRDAGIMSKLGNDFAFNSTILISIKEIMTQLRRSGKLIVEKTDSEDEEDEEAVVEDSTEITLTVEHLQGPFTMLILGLIISITVFLLEFIFNTKVMRRIVGKIEKYFQWKSEDTMRKFREKFLPKKIEKKEFKARRNAEIRFTPKHRRDVGRKSKKIKKKVRFFDT